MSPSTHSQSTSEKNTTAKVALVTGTSTGIGFHTALQLADAGFNVVATMRDVSKASPLLAAAQAAGVTLDVRALDVTDDASVAGCVNDVVARYERIDLVVNNAGAGYLGTLEQTPLSAARRTMETNFFGVWRVTQAIFPNMRAAQSGQIITVTSIGGLVGQPFNDAYCAAKFAIEGFMESLAPVALQFGIRLSLIEPGPVHTEFVASVLAQLPETTPALQAVYGPLIDAYKAGTERAYAAMGETPEQVAQVIRTAATAATPDFRYPTSEAVRLRAAQKYVDPTGASFVGPTASRNA